MELAILIPALGRAEVIAPLIQNIEETSELPHMTYFITSPRDRHVHEAIERARDLGPVRNFIVKWRPMAADYAKKINWAYRMTHEPLLFQGATDLRFHPGWDQRALKYAKREEQCVIGTNDLGNPAVKRGQHSTHSFFTRAYIQEQGGVYDGKGVVLCEVYDHQFCDTEFVQTAKERGVFFFSRNSHVEHMHPYWKKSPMDNTYRKALRHGGSDHRLYNERIADFRSRQ